MNKDQTIKTAEDDVLKAELQAVTLRWHRLGYNTLRLSEEDTFHIKEEARRNIAEREEFVSQGILPRNYLPSQYSEQPLQVGRFVLIGNKGFDDHKVDLETVYDTLEEAVSALVKHPRNVTYDMGVGFDDGANERPLIWSEWRNDGADHSYKYASEYIAGVHSKARQARDSELHSGKPSMLPSQKSVLPPKTVGMANDDDALEHVEPPNDLDFDEEEELAVAKVARLQTVRRVTPVMERNNVSRSNLSDDDAVVLNNDAIIKKHDSTAAGGWIEAADAPVPAISSESNVENDPFALPGEIEKKYLVKREAQIQKLFRQNEKLPAIIDRGGSLRALGSDADTVRDIVDIALHREWSLLKLRGSKTFRQEAWIEATARGLKVEGYLPSEFDIQEAIQRSSTFGEQVAERGSLPGSAAADLETAMKIYDKNMLEERHVPAKSNDNWFDLGPHGAKLERLPISEDSGEYYLRLEIDAVTLCATCVVGVDPSARTSNGSFDFAPCKTSPAFARVILGSPDIALAERKLAPVI